MAETEAWPWRHDYYNFTTYWGWVLAATFFVSFVMMSRKGA